MYFSVVYWIILLLTDWLVGVVFVEKPLILENYQVSEKIGGNYFHQSKRKEYIFIYRMKLYRMVSMSHI